MVCSRCRKPNAAQFFVMEKGVKKSVCLCANCYDAFYVGRGEHALFQERQSQTRGACPSCGMKYAEYEKTGLVGCAECYNSFRPQLLGELERLQNSTEHVGSKPAGSGKMYLQMRGLVGEYEVLEEEITRAWSERNNARAKHLMERLKKIEHTLEVED